MRPYKEVVFRGPGGEEITEPLKSGIKIDDGTRAKFMSAFSQLLYLLKLGPGQGRNPDGIGLSGRDLGEVELTMEHLAGTRLGQMMINAAAEDFRKSEAQGVFDNWSQPVEGGGKGGLPTTKGISDKK